MEQVKIFTRNAKLIEKQINKWLEEHQDIKILDRLQSTSKDGVLAISIFYKIKE